MIEFEEEDVVIVVVVEVLVEELVVDVLVCVMVDVEGTKGGELIGTRELLVDRSRRLRVERRFEPLGFINEKGEVREERDKESLEALREGGEG